MTFFFWKTTVFVRLCAYRVQEFVVRRNNHIGRGANAVAVTTTTAYINAHRKKGEQLNIICVCFCRGQPFATPTSRWRYLLMSPSDDGTRQGTRPDNSEITNVRAELWNPHIFVFSSISFFINIDFTFRICCIMLLVSFWQTCCVISILNKSARFSVTSIFIGTTRKNTQIHHSFKKQN